MVHSFTKSPKARRRAGVPVRPLHLVKCQNVLAANFAEDKFKSYTYSRFQQADVRLTLNAMRYMPACQKQQLFTAHCAGSLAA